MVILADIFIRQEEKDLVDLTEGHQIGQLEISVSE